jgi:hypothetical protein
MPSATKSRTTWIWILAGLVVVAGIAVFATLIITNGKSDAEPTHNPGSSSEPTQSATPGDADTTPTGCLGGIGRDAAMVLEAQDLAPQTSTGAVEVAAAFVRWLNQYPYPTAEDARLIQTHALAKEAPTQDIAGFFEGGPNLSGGLVPDHTDYYLSTVAGVYHIESVSPEAATISIGTSLVENGAISPSLKGSITVSLAWEDGGWKFVSSEGTRTTEDLFAVGQDFTDGC